jgi:hypothetical protein
MSSSPWFTRSGVARERAGDRSPQRHAVTDPRRNAARGDVLPRPLRRPKGRQHRSRLSRARSSIPLDPAACTDGALPFSGGCERIDHQIGDACPGRDAVVRLARRRALASVPQAAAADGARRGRSECTARASQIPGSAIPPEPLFRPVSDKQMARTLTSSAVYRLAECRREARRSLSPLCHACGQPRVRLASRAPGRLPGVD